MPSTTIMVVDLAVVPARKEEFDAFYQDFYIPELLNSIPQITTARRFAQTNAENRNGKVHYLTVYELSSNNALVDVDKAISESAHRQASDRFKLWKHDGLTHFKRDYYSECFLSQRECPTNDLWAHNDVCALFWKMPSCTVAIEHLIVARDISNELTFCAIAGACRTYQITLNDSDTAIYMSILTAPDQVYLRQTISKAEKILKSHAKTANLNHSPSATMALQMIYSRLNVNNDV